MGSFSQIFSERTAPHGGEIVLQGQNKSIGVAAACTGSRHLLSPPALPTKELVNQMCQTDPSLGSAIQDPNEMVYSGSAWDIPAMTWTSASRKLPVGIVKRFRSMRSEGNQEKRNCQRGFFKSKFLSIFSTLRQENQPG